MGKIKKKGVSGQAKNFITRTQAVRKLQITLPDFRKLCIWKGIYPREPRNKRKASSSSTASTTFYYTKDIQYLLHEPLLQKFREQKALERKISKALGRGDAYDAQRLEKNALALRPERTGRAKYTLDHVIRERYPTFIDALRDLDDCLSMLFLFANLPSTTTVPAKMIARCERLCLEFEHYLIVSHSLRKSFLSIKGIYYQATIQGQDILWLVPYRFNQRVTSDVDFRIMGTFVEFYQTLLGFVNFRLYTSIGLVYPPKFDTERDDQGAELGAFTLEGNGVGPLEVEQPRIAEGKSSKPNPKLQAEIDRLMSQLNQPEITEQLSIDEKAQGEEEDPASDMIDKFEPVAPGGDILLQPSYSTTDPSTLFSNFTFFLSRETPRQPIEFLLRAFGCKRIGWDAVLGDGAFTHNEFDPSITHHVVDRPPIQPIVANGEEYSEDNQTKQRLRADTRVPGRIYIQPQWIWDCVNDEELKRSDQYAPGAQLPPHLSPFVRKIQGQYDPSAPLADQEREDEELEMDSGSDDEPNVEEEDGQDNLEDLKLRNGIVDLSAMDSHDLDASMTVAASDDDEEDSDNSNGSRGEGSFGGFSEAEADESEDEAASTAIQRQRELESEFTGVAIKEDFVDPRTKAKADARKKAAKQKQAEDEELERAKMMMSRRKRKTLEKMVYSNKKKDAEAEALRAKRRKIEKAGARLSPI